MKAIIFSSLLAVAAMNSFAAGNAFTYQGRLIDEGAPADGDYDLVFRLATALSGGFQVGNAVTNLNVPVNAGLFIIELDFGAEAFNGEHRWLDISVRRSGNPGAFTGLAPRQPLTPAPYALYASNAGSATTAASVGTSAVSTAGLQENAVVASKIAPGHVVKSLNGLSDTISLAAGSNVSITPNGNTLTISASGGGAGNFGWQLGGNSGTTPGMDFIGTTDNAPVEIRVHGGRALRLEPASTNDSVNVIAGSELNYVAPGLSGATISGGGIGDYFGYGLAFSNSVTGHFGTVGGGIDNHVYSLGGAIGGGMHNTLADGAMVSLIAGGIQNTIASPKAVVGGGVANGIDIGSPDSVIAGGLGNTIGASSFGTAISGGSLNKVAENADNSVISGGIGNEIFAGSLQSVVGGGGVNRIQAASPASVVAGGKENQVGAASEYAVVSGGWKNFVSAPFATVPGGSNNTASAAFSFAAGRRARATHQGAFVWADSTDANIASAAANSVTFRASGGVRIFSNAGASTGVSLAAGGGSWANLSDRDTKENLQPVHAREVLERVAALPIAMWNYKSQDTSVRHLGPMAQDFYAAFGLGDDERHITSVDADGVALAAIQGLDIIGREQAETIEALRQRIRTLEERLLKLEQAASVR